MEVNSTLHLPIVIESGCTLCEKLQINPNKIFLINHLKHIVMTQKTRNEPGK